MLSAVELLRTLADDRPWLIVGKGPTSDHLSSFDTSKYRCLTLNHACKVVEPAAAHFVDVEAFEACRTYLFPPTLVLMPWHPHHRFHPSIKAVIDWPAIATLAADARLGTYNATTAGKLPKHPDVPTIRLTSFGATAAFNLLIAAGVRAIFSIGVDGGTGYGAAFDPADRLANGRKSFDAQTCFIRDSVQRNKVRWVRLGEEGKPIK
jgi:hypothetical protein